MYKRLALAAIFAILLTGLSYGSAGPITLPVNCENGTQYGTGTFDPLTGAISVTFPLSHCIKNGLDISGPVVLSGTVNSQTGAVNVTINYETLTITDSDIAINSPSCALNLNGVYDISTGVYNGKQTIGCVWEGSITAALNEVVFLLFM